MIYRNHPDGWVAEVPAIAGCHALIPTPQEAVTELVAIFRAIEDEYRETGGGLASPGR